MQDINWGLMFLYFTAGAFWAVMAIVNLGKPLIRYLEKRQPKQERSEKLDALIERLKKEAADAIKNVQKDNPNIKFTLKTPPNEAGREVHKFQWRHGGKMNEVDIIIDPSIDKAIAGSKEDFEKMVREGDAGKLEDILGGIINTDDAEKLSASNAFVFSKRVVEQLKLTGMSPDELVAKILKAQGRMD